METENIKSKRLRPIDWIGITLGVGVAGWLVYDCTAPVFPGYSVSSEVAKIMVDLENEGEEICLSGGDFENWLDRYMAVFEENHLEYDGTFHCRSGFPGEDPRFGVTTAFVNTVDSYGRAWELVEYDEVSATFKCKSWVHPNTSHTVEISVDGG